MRRPRFDIGELRAFLEEKLETRFVRFDLITTCSRPENFRAETADGRRLAVKCVPAEKTRIRYFADHFVPHLEELRGSRAIQLVGSPLKFADCTVAVVEWCLGRRVMPDRLTDAQFAELVSTYREFSASLQNVSQVLPPRPNLKVREKALALLSAPSCRWLRDFVERALTDGVLAYDASRLRVIHGDFHHGNFHFDGDRITGVMDLEDIRYGYPADDWVRYIVCAAEHLHWFDFAGRRRLLERFVGLLPEAPADEWREAVGGLLIRKIWRRFDRRKGWASWLSFNFRFRLPFYRSLFTLIDRYCS